MRPDVRAPDPGLGRAHIAGFARLARRLDQHGVDRPKVVQLERHAARAQLDGALHGPDVAHHRARRLRRRRGIVESARQATMRNARTLHPRGGDGLGPQELMGEGLEILPEMAGLDVAGPAPAAGLQIPQGPLRLGEELGQTQREAEAQAFQARRHIGPIRQGFTPCQDRVASPAFDGTLDLGHEIPRLRQSSWNCHAFMEPSTRKAVSLVMDANGWRPILGRAVLWMPIAAVARLMAVIAFVLTQQHLTVAASDPRVQVAEHAVARLDSGTDARSIVPAKTVGIASSSDPYLVVFDRTRRVPASSAALHGRMGQVIMGWLGSLSATALAGCLFSGAGRTGDSTSKVGAQHSEKDVSWSSYGGFRSHSRATHPSSSNPP